MRESKKLELKAKHNCTGTVFTIFNDIGTKLSTYCHIVPFLEF